MSEQKDPSLLSDGASSFNEMHRRAQSAEAGLRDALANWSGGPSFGRALANSAATMYAAQLKESEAQRSSLAQRVAELEAGLPTLRRVHSASCDPASGLCVCGAPEHNARVSALLAASAKGEQRQESESEQKQGAARPLHEPAGGESGG